MRKLILALTFFLLFQNLIHANSFSWIGAASTNLNTAANWSPTGVPTASDNITITNAGTFRPVLTGSYTTASLTMANSNGNTLDLGGFTLTISKTAAIAGGTISNGSLLIGSSSSAASSAAFGSGSTGPIISASVVCYSSILTMAGATFNADVTLFKTSSGSGLSTGGNIFNGALNANNSGSVPFSFSESTVFSDMFNDIAVFNNTGSSTIVLAAKSAGTTFAKKVTFNNTSTSNNAQIIVARDSASSATFKDSVIVNNSGSSINSHNIYFAVHSKSSVIYNGNISLSNTYTSAASTTVQFGPGVNTLSEGKTISIAAAGFTVGTLKLQNFKQGTVADGTDQNIVLTGSAMLNILAGTVFNGKTSLVSPRLNLFGGTYNGTTSVEKTGSLVDQSGNNNFNGVTTITNSYVGSGSTPPLSDLFLGYSVGNPDTFSTDVTFNNKGTRSIRIAYNSLGNVFNGKVTCNNTSSGTYGRITFAELSGSSATVGGIATFSNTAADSVGVGRSGIVKFNNNIIVSNATSKGVYFGGGSGTISLAEGMTLSIGSGGFATGVLVLANFTQGTVVGGTTYNLPLTGTVNLQLGPKSIFNGNVSFVSPRLSLNGATFNGITYLEKNGVNTDYSMASNIYNGLTTITNSSSAEFWLGEAVASPDTFNGKTIFNNTGGGSIEVGSRSPGYYFAKPVTFNNAGTGTSSRISIARDYRGGSNTSIIFNDSVIFNNASSAFGYIEAYVNGSCTYNGNLIVANTSGFGVFFGGNLTFGTIPTIATGTATLKADKKISIGTSFSTGTLLLRNFTHGNTTAGAANHDLTLTGSSTTITLGPSSKFSGNVNILAPRVTLNGCTFEGITNIEKNGAGDDLGASGDVFNGATTITNSGSGILWIGSAAGAAESFNSATTFNNIGTSGIDVCDRASGSVFIGNTIFNNSGTGTSNFIRVCEAWNPSFSKGTATFSGSVTFKNVGTGSLSSIRSNNNGSCVFNNDVILTSTGGLGISFGQTSGTATLAENKTISLLSDGTFSAGSCILKGFTQGTTPGLSSQNLKLTGTSVLTLGSSSVFNGNVNFVSPQIYLEGVVFNGDTTKIEKTGGGNPNNSSGNNIFNSVTTITNTGSADFGLATVSPDVFNKSVTFAGTGTISPATTGQNTFAGDLTCNALLSFNKGTGLCYFTGPSLQNIQGTIPPTIPRFTIDKASGKINLASDLTVSTVLSLQNGYIDLNSKSLKVTNTATAAISRASGYILSEKTDNSSKILWTINTTTGKHIFPFGKPDGTYIPLTVDVTGGNVGIFTASTYPTSPDNLPYPISPDSISSLGATGPNLVDRFWYTEETGTNGVATLTFTYANSEKPVNGEMNLKAERFQKSNSTWMIPVVSPVVDTVANTVSISGISVFSTWALSLTNLTATINASQTENANLSLFPNPSTGGDMNISLISGSSGEGTVVVYNALGEEVFSKSVSLITGQETRFDLGDKLTAGTYLVTVTSADKIYRKKLIVK